MEKLEEKLGTYNFLAILRKNRVRSENREQFRKSKDNWHPNLEENLNVNTAMKKDTLKEIVKFGRIETKKFKKV